MLPTSRKSALAIGQKYYFTGEPCKYGHIEKRYVGNGGCVVCLTNRTNKWIESNYEKHIKSKTEGTRKWRLKNPDRFKMSNHLYWVKNKDKQLAAKRDWRRNNKERDKAYARGLYHKYIEKQRLRSRENNRKDPEGRRARTRNRRAKQRSAEGKHCAADVKRLYSLQKGKCAYCRIYLNEYHVDHIVSIAAGGSNYPKNLQILCGPCNMSKGASDPIDFAQRKGMLL